MEQRRFMEGVCKRCGRQAELVRSHVIPRAFFELPPQGTPGGPLRLIGNAAGTYPRRAPIGVYDFILCDECERFFSDVDDYAADRLLHSQGNFSALRHEGKLVAYEVHDVNYSLLKRFFMSVLWRAAVSSHVFFQKVSLGPYRARLLEMLNARDPGGPDEYAVVLAIFDDHPAATAMMDPFHRRKAVSHYQFQLNKFIAQIKVDRRPFEHGLREVQLSDRSPLLIVVREFTHSKEFKVMRSLAQKNAGRERLRC
jgi:hypothetical protein